jgi:hypothetical protein
MAFYDVASNICQAPPDAHLGVHVLHEDALGVVAAGLERGTEPGHVGVQLQGAPDVGGATATQGPAATFLFAETRLSVRL